MIFVRLNVSLLHQKKLADEYLDYEGKLEQLTQIGAEQNPELINDNPNTAPSKRILAAIPEYSKAIGGINVVNAIGIEKIRQRCQHFSEWLEQLEQLVRS